RAYDDVQYTNSLLVQVSVYDPTAGYKLGGILLSEYKIKPGRAPGSNLAIEGAWDMPARTGKVYHEWPDENGVEPYLLPEEIFFAGRDIIFHGILHAESDAEAREMLDNLYSDFDKSSSVQVLSCKWGSWEVHILKEVKVSKLRTGMYKVEIPFRQPVVEMTGTVPSGESNSPGIDGLTWNELGLHINQTIDAGKRANARQVEVT